jgi:predicted nucleic acid-binding protein
MTILADTSFLYAVIDPRDRLHTSAIPFYRAATEPILFPTVALTELALLANRIGGSPATVLVMEAILKSKVSLVDPTSADYVRTLEILTQYTDSRIDFVDACIMAIAERLQISRILTFDHRDFGLYRPIHIPHFELLP